MALPRLIFLPRNLVRRGLVLCSFSLFQFSRRYATPLVQTGLSGIHLSQGRKITVSTVPREVMSVTNFLISPDETANRVGVGEGHYLLRGNPPRNAFRLSPRRVFGGIFLSFLASPQDYVVRLKCSVNQFNDLGHLALRFYGSFSVLSIMELSRMRSRVRVASSSPAHHLSS